MPALGMLITVEPVAKVPSAEDYLKEIGNYLTKEKAQVTALDSRCSAEPVQLDRFGLDATSARTGLGSNTRY